MKTKSPWYSVAYLGLVLIGLSFPVADTWAAATVTGKALVSEVRTGRTTFDYTYQVTVQNGAPALGSASATVTSSSPSTVVLDGDVSLGDLAANSTVTSVDTFTIRQNRLVPFDPASLTWVVQGSPIVPNVVGLTQAAATTAITGAGLVLGNVTTQNSASVAVGSVISQNPLAGASVAPGSAVDLVISSGPAPVSVPNVVGLTQAAATTAITGAGLVVGTVSTQNSASVAAGSVISQNPVGGTSVAPGSAVNLVVSSGPAPVSVPNVVGLTQAAATTAITGAGLVLGNVSTQNSASVAAGNVISQNPLGGASVAPGSAVDLVISSGPAPVSVPNVVGLTQAAATTAITGAGLVLGNVTTQNSASVAAGNVISQNPSGGASVSGGTTVDITVSIGPAGATPSSLKLSLSQFVVGAGDPLTVTSQVLDGGGNPIASPPSVDYTIVWNATTSTGTVPGMNGNSIVTQSNTRGSFQLQGTVHGTSVTATIGFTVLQNASQSGNAALFTGQSLAQAQVTQNIEAILAAVQSGDTTAIAPLKAAMTAAAATVKPDLIGFATAYEPDTGFIPTTAQLVSRYPATAADTNYATLTGNIRTKINQITALLNTPTGNDAADTATLATYVADLTALQAQVGLAANTPTPNGLTKNTLAVDALLGDDMPALLRALANRVSAQLLAAGLASNQVQPDSFYRSIGEGSPDRPAVAQLPGAMYSTQQPAFLLVGMLGYGGTVGNLIQKIYGPFLDQLQKMAILLAAQGLLNANIDNLPGVIGLKAGSGFSFATYGWADSVIELTSISVAQAQSAEVYLVGGAAINAIDEAANAVGGITGVHTIHDLYNFLKGLYDALQGLAGGVAQAHQQPDFVLQTSADDGGCLSSGGSCIELHYNNGFNYVGSGGPIALEPVIILIRIPDPTSPGYGSAIFNFAGR